MDPTCFRQCDAFPERYCLSRDVTIEAEAGHEMTFDSSLRSSLGQMGDPVFVSTGRKIRKDVEDSMTSSQMSIASMQSTSSLGILQLDSMGDLSASLLQLDGSCNLSRFSSGTLDGQENGSKNPTGERGNATGFESIDESSEIDTEDELEAVRRETAKRVLYPVSSEERVGLHAGDGGESSASDGTHQSRPRLEGGSSDEQSWSRPSSPRQEMSLRQSAEGEVVKPLALGGGDGGGDGMSDGESGSSLTAPSVVSGAAASHRRILLRSWSSQSGYSDQERNVEGSVFSDAYQTPTPEMSGLAAHFLLPSLRPKSAGSMSDPPRSPELRPLSSASSFHFEEGVLGSSQEGLAHRFCTSGLMEGGVTEDRRGNGAEDDEDQDTDKTLIGATGNGELGAFEDDVNTERDIRQIQQMMSYFDKPPVASSSKQSKVYNPFDSMQTDPHGTDVHNVQFPQYDGEFMAQDDAEAVLEEDQRAFEREHKFREDEYIASDQFSDHGASRWTPPDKSHVTLGSPGSSEEECFDERVSLGEFMRTRTEALGSLSGERGIKRPSFGTGHIKTPEGREPVALVEMSRLSLVSEEQERAEAGVPGIHPMGDLGESIRFAGVGSDTEEHHTPRIKSTLHLSSQLVEDSDLSLPELDGYSAGKESIPMASLYFRAADPEGSAVSYQQQPLHQNASGDSKMAALDLEELSLTGHDDVNSRNDSKDMSRLSSMDGDMNCTPVETPDMSQTIPSNSFSKPNLKVPPFQEVTPMFPRQILHLREESEPDGTRTPPLATSSIAAAIVNASSTTKPEDFAAMIVALSNKNRQVQKARDKAEHVNRAKSVDVHSDNTSPKYVEQKSCRKQRCTSSSLLATKQESHLKDSLENPADMTGSRVNLPGSDKDRNARESRPHSQQDSKGGYGNMTTNADHKVQLHSIDMYARQQKSCGSYKSRSPSHSEIPDGAFGKSTDQRMREIPDHFENAPRSKKSGDGVKVAGEAYSEQQSRSTTVTSTSEKPNVQKIETSPRESADSSFMNELVGMELSFDSRMKVHAERIKIIQRAQEACGETLETGIDSSDSLDSDTLLCTPRSSVEGHDRIQSKPKVNLKVTNGLAKKLSLGYQQDSEGRTETGSGSKDDHKNGVSQKMHRSKDGSCTVQKTVRVESRIADPEDLSRKGEDFTGHFLNKQPLQSSNKQESICQKIQEHCNLETDPLERSGKPHDGATLSFTDIDTTLHGNASNETFFSDDESEHLREKQASWIEYHSSRQPSSNLEPEKLPGLERGLAQTTFDSGEQKKEQFPAIKQDEKLKDEQLHSKSRHDTPSPTRERQRCSASPNITPSVNKSPASLYSTSSSLSESATQTSDDDTTNTPSAQPQTSQHYGPPIQSFQVFQKDHCISTCVASTTPTLLTSHSLLTDALMKQYLNEQAVTSRPPSTYSVAPSYISDQRMKSLDVVQTCTSINPAVVSASTVPNLAPHSSLPTLTINTGEGTSCPSQLQRLDSAYPPNIASGALSLLTSAQDRGPVLDRVPIPGQISSVDTGVLYPPPHPASATRPVVPLQPHQTSASSVYPASVPGLGSLSATSFSALPTFQAAPVSRYPVTVIPSRSGTAQEHGPPQPTRVNTQTVNPVEVSSINIKGVCCIGVAKQAVLPLKNPGPRWLQCHMEVVSVSINGEELPPDSLTSFLVKRRTIISPQNSEDIKVVFIPHLPGIYVAQVLVSSSPVVADGEVAYLNQGAPVTVIARAEKPNIGVKGAQNGTLDLGVLSYGKERSAPIYLVNHGSSTVPLRLLIKVNSSAWHSFYLHTGDSKVTPDMASGLNLPSHITLESQNDSATLWVHFRACQHEKAGCTDAPEQVSAKLEVWLDIPEGGGLPITGVTLRATVGLAKLNIPRALTREISLKSQQGEHTGRKLPLKNTGNIHLDLELTVASAQRVFSAVPQAILLAPGQEVEAFVKYTPREVPSRDVGQLSMCARPDGPSYEVMLRGETVEKRLDSTQPYFLVNRHYISWGGVPIGRALQQKLTIRSCSKIDALKLKLYITENKQDFQLLNPFKTGEWSTDESQYVTLQPQEDLRVHILFSPTSVATSQAKLNIKPQARNFKYTVPLSGYGGVSKLILENICEIEHGLYSVSLGQCSTNHSTACTITVSNVGRRSAFLKALGFRDEEGRDKLLGGHLQVEPAEFIIQAKTQRKVTITLTADEEEIKKRSGTAEGFLAGVGLFYGDEISRQQHRRALKHKDSEAVNLSEHNPLCGISLDLPIPGEAKVNEVCDLPWRSGDLNLFYRCISRLMVHLTGHVVCAENHCPAVTTTSMSPVKTLEKANTGMQNKVECEDPSSRQRRVPHTPPVKDTPAARHPVLPISSTSDVVVVPSPVGPAGVDRIESWSVQPQQLLLTTPGADLGVQKSHSIRLANHSVRHLRFETMHTPDCLIVTPAAGVVESSKQLYILVSCNPAIRSKGVQLPWRGGILVVCDGRQKEVKVQIREEFGVSTSIVPSRCKTQSLPDQPVTPDTSIGPTWTDRASPVKILSKVGGTSEATLEFQNNTCQTRQWCLSSFAPTYVKQAYGEVFRATYSAFRFTHQFGCLEPGQNIAVHLEFIPRDAGAYSQYWDLESSDKGAVAKSSHKTRIELMGVGDAVQPVPRPKKSKISEGTLIPVQPQAIAKHTTQGHVTAVENTNPADPSKRAVFCAQTALSYNSSEYVKTHAEKTNQSPDSKSAQGVVLVHDHLIFSKTKLGSRSTLKIQVQNTSKQTHTVSFLSPQPPFFIRHYQHTIPPNRFIRLPITFKPTKPGRHQAALIVQTEGQHKLLSRLEGSAESN